MDIVLVHGAWHGAWCWEKLTPILESDGHRVLTPEMPIEDGFEPCVDAVLEVVTDCHEPLVAGHSMAGAVISRVAEQVPDRIGRLIFLAAFAPQDGESVGSLAGGNLANALRDNIAPDDEGYLIVNPDVVPAAFYADCSADDIDAAIPRLRRQHASAFSTRLELSQENYGACDKQYIECIEDQAIHISLQRQMAIAAGCTLINSMRTSHSPFFSAPAELAGFITTSGPPPS